MHIGEVGDFPSSLSEIKVVPVPLNPMTGKPFSYKLEGDRATIELPKSDGIWKTKQYVLELR